MTTKVETRKLGLAAYIKMKGGELVKYANNKFTFEVEDGGTESEWEVRYLNSCCHKHDTELMNLRKLIR
ncbi:MAG: hypothetical protein ACWGQW_01270 [bacterium]